MCLYTLLANPLEPSHVSCKNICYKKSAIYLLTEENVLIFISTVCMQKYSSAIDSLYVLNVIFFCFLVSFTSLFCSVLTSTSIYHCIHAFTLEIY